MFYDKFSVIEVGMIFGRPIVCISVFGLQTRPKARSCGFDPFLIKLTGLILVVVNLFISEIVVQDWDIFLVRLDD